MEIEPMETSFHSSGASIRRPTLSLDLALYETYFADSTLIETQKTELLQALWSIIVGFVDLGFTVEAADCDTESPREVVQEFASAGSPLLQSSSDNANIQTKKAAAQDVPAGN